MARGNEIALFWVPAHSGVAGSEVADDLAKEAADGAPHCELKEVSDAIRWPTSLPHLSRRGSERQTRETGQWIAAHMRSERRYHQPGGPGHCRKALRKVWKALAGRHYQLLSGHAAIGSFVKIKRYHTDNYRRFHEAPTTRWYAYAITPIKRYAYAVTEMHTHTAIRPDG